MATARPPEVPPPAPRPPPPATGDLIATTSRAFFDAVRARDASALSPLYEPSAVVDVGPGALRANGPAEVGTAAGSLFAAFPDAKTQWSFELVAGEARAFELAWTGTETGALGALPATNKVIGTRALLVERFAPSGRLRSQDLYLDVDAFLADARTKAGKPHPFDGLPTMQASVGEDAVLAPPDADVEKQALASLRQGSYADLRPLGAATTVWLDATKGRSTTGKGALVAWTSFLEHAFKGGGPKLAEAWTAGPWLVLEWRGDGGARVAELVRVADAHIEEIRTYRGPAPAPQGASRAPRGKNQ